jgi:predicted RND superfamily exporter protein
MIPNLVPLAILFGLMGIFGVPLEGGSVVVGPIAIGIAVDDTIHLLFSYTKSRRAGVEPIQAMRMATAHCGRAVATTSCALALGFLAMTVSKFQSVASIGALSAAAIFAAAITEVLLLPALIACVAAAQKSSSGIHKG